jgi:DnaJ like chaperone protein
MKTASLRSSFMNYRGKIVGTLIGALIFMAIELPVVGLVLGFAAGHYLFDRRRLSATDKLFKQFKVREWLFIQHAFKLCAKMAKAKGGINSYEIKFMERLITSQFKLKDDARKKVIEIWNEAKTSNQSFEELALKFHLDFGNERHHVVNMMDMLIGIAACDQTLHPKEETLLHKASSIFKISRLQYDRIRERHIAPKKAQEKWTPLDPHYAILGATPQEDLQTIKQKYRTLVKKWHPDTLNAQNASSEAMRHANKKFQEIKEAYEMIVAKAG